MKQLLIDLMEQNAINEGIPGGEMRACKRMCSWRSCTGPAYALPERDKP